MRLIQRTPRRGSQKCLQPQQNEEEMEHDDAMFNVMQQIVPQYPQQPTQGIQQPMAANPQMTTWPSPNDDPHELHSGGEQSSKNRVQQTAQSQKGGWGRGRTPCKTLHWGGPWRHLVHYTQRCKKHQAILWRLDQPLQKSRQKSQARQRVLVLGAYGIDNDIQRHIKRMHNKGSILTLKMFWPVNRSVEKRQDQLQWEERQLHTWNAGLQGANWDLANSGSTSNIYHGPV